MRSVVAAACGDGLRVDGEERDGGAVLGGQGDRWHHRGHIGLGFHRAGEVLERRRVGRPVVLGHQQEGSVESGSEALGQQVVGLAGGGADRIVPLVGGPEAEREEGQGDQDHDEEGHQRREDRAAADEVRPLGPEPLGARSDHPGSVGGEVPLLLAAQHPGTDEGEQGGQQGERGDHGEGHAECGGDGQPVEEGHPEGEHPEESDADDDPGEENGPSRRVDGVPDG